MGDFAGLAKMTVGQLAVLVALFLPGFVSLKVDRLVQPGRDLGAPELAIEAFAYSVINAGLLSWPIVVVLQQLGSATPNYAVLWPLSVLVCVIGPSLWPLLLRAVQRLGVDRGLLLGPHRYAWDNFFGRREPCWLIIHLSDKQLVGAYFGDRSYATVEPNSGHLYVEELWRLSSDGEFVEKLQNSKGGLFRPGDYDWIEVFSDE